MAALTLTAGNNAAAGINSIGNAETNDSERNDESPLDKEIAMIKEIAEDHLVLMKLSLVKCRDDVLLFPRNLRLAWFYSMRMNHAKMRSAMQSIGENLSLGNKCKIITLVGMSGAGKSTLLSGESLLTIMRSYCGEIKVGDVPFIVVSVPAHGADHKCSWGALYREILSCGFEILIAKKRQAVEIKDGGSSILRVGANSGLGVLRYAIGMLLKNRNVKIIAIDEAVHLLNMGKLASTINALKSMADLHSASKLILVGSFDILPFVTQDPQIIRRNEIVHFERYKIRAKIVGELTRDEKEFFRIIEVMEEWWPMEIKPLLKKNWHQIALACLGAIGFLKDLILRLLILQSRSKNGVITSKMWARASKSAEALHQVEMTVSAGEESLKGWQYGIGAFSAAQLKELSGENE
jgi:hypothetical protein